MIDCNITTNYFNEKLRMTKKTSRERCQIKCSECPLSILNNGTSERMTCVTFETLYPEKAISAIQRWSDEHPQKTFLTEFLEKYPNAELRIDGIPKGVCPYALGLINRDDCQKKDHNCVECWNQPIEDGEE